MHYDFQDNRLDPTVMTHDGQPVDVIAFASGTAGEASHAVLRADTGLLVGVPLSTVEDGVGWLTLSSTELAEAIAAEAVSDVMTGLETTTPTELTVPLIRSGDLGDVVIYFQKPDAGGGVDGPILG